MKLMLISLILMLNEVGLTLFAAVSIYRGDNLAGSAALLFAGLGVLLMSLSEVVARKESPDAHGNQPSKSGS